MQTRKVVINTCFGGFNLSEEAIAAYAMMTGMAPEEVYTWEMKRDDPALVDVVETLGGDMGYASKLKVVEIPVDVRWHIEEYDGVEHVAEAHRTWY